MSDVVIHRRDVVRDVSVTVRFEAGRTWSVRMWLASMLMRMAGRVVGCMVTVEVSTGCPDQSESQATNFD